MSFASPSLRTRPPCVALLFDARDALSAHRTELMVGSLALEGAWPVRLQPSDVQPDGTVHAQIHRQGRWQPLTAVAVDAVIDWLPAGYPRSAALTQWVQRHPHTQVPQMDDAALLALCLDEPEIRPWVAPTQCNAKPEVALAMLRAHGCVWLKPRDRYQAQPVQVKAVAAGFHIQDAMAVHTLDETALRDGLAHRLAQGGLVQADVASASVTGRRYALQVTVQQRADGAWMVPTLQCLLATDTPYASLWAGAEHIGTPFAPLWDNVVLPRQHPAFAGLQVRLQGLAMIWAHQLQRRWGSAPVGAIAFRVVLDAQLRPWVIGVDARPPAPTRAARNLEFFKHWSALALRLAATASETPPVHAIHPNDLNHADPTPRPGVTTAHTHSPALQQGVSVRSHLSAALIEALLAQQPAWLDVGLGSGSRALLARWVALNAERTPPQSQWLSLRVGMAASDGADPQGRWPRVQALEDFVGRGLLNASELKLMRSVRRPLLECQWRLLQAVLGGARPALLWLDDTDLGLRALPPAQRMAALQDSMQWLSERVHAGEAGAWGLIFYNASVPQTQDWVLQALALAPRQLGFAGVCFRTPAAPAVLQALAQQGVPWWQADLASQGVCNLQIGHAAPVGSEVPC